MDANVICGRRARLKRGAAALTALALAACHPPPPEKDGPAPAATAAATTVLDVSKPIRALGTEPFWNLDVKGTHFTLARPGVADVTATAAGAELQHGQAHWRATTPDGKALEVTFYVSNCSDGMSNKSYPMAAEVSLGGETLHGCATSGPITWPRG